MSTQKKIGNSYSLYQQQRNEYFICLLFFFLIVSSAIAIEIILYKPEMNSNLLNVVKTTASLLHSQQQLGTTLLKSNSLDDYPELANKVLTSLTNHPTIHYAALVNKEGELVTRSIKSASQNPYRWITDLLKNSQDALVIPLSQHKDKPLAIKSSQNILQNQKVKRMIDKQAYLLVELDAYHLRYPFLRRLIVECIILITCGLILSGFFVWFHRKYYTNPLMIISNTIDHIIPSSSEKQQLDLEEHQSSIELSCITNSINRLIKTITINTARRERAEDDLRKNLASIDSIVSERTNALRSSNIKVQSILSKQESKASLLEYKFKDLTLSLNKIMDDSKHEKKGLNINDILRNAKNIYGPDLNKKKISTLTVLEKETKTISLNKNNSLLQVITETLKLLSNYCGKNSLTLSANDLEPEKMTISFQFSEELKKGGDLCDELEYIKTVKEFEDSSLEIEDMNYAFFKKQLQSIHGSLEVLLAEKRVCLYFPVKYS